MIYFLIVVAALFVAYANGANDNFKGVATLFGSGTTNYRRALAWATATTLLGSLAAFFLAATLIESFGGKGLIEDAVAAQPYFAASVAFGAGLTVMLATFVGLPISTTHALVGSLVGAGIVAGSTLNVATLGSGFLLPLLLSPLLAILITAALYPLLRTVRGRMGITSDFCLCVGNETIEVVSASSQTLAMERAERLTATLGDRVTCESRYQGKLLGISAGQMLDRLHYVSAGVVSFARGLNDTPKIAAILLLVPAIGAQSGLAMVGIIIAVGAIINARRVAETMSHRITAMNHGQGFTANFVTGAIVIGASVCGLPVSTTHVSCGSLFGIGTVTRKARLRMIGVILLAWLITLPLAALLAGSSAWLLQSAS